MRYLSGPYKSYRFTCTHSYILRGVIEISYFNEVDNVCSGVGCQIHYGTSCSANTRLYRLRICTESCFEILDRHKMPCTITWQSNDLLVESNRIIVMQRYISDLHTIYKNIIS